MDRVLESDREVLAESDNGLAAPLLGLGQDDQEIGTLTQAGDQLRKQRLVGTSARGDVEVAATILGATEAAREAMGVGPDEDEQRIRTAALEIIDGADVEPDTESGGMSGDSGGE